MTPRELMNAYHGYLWRRQQNENMLASLVTTWIANYAGKSSKKKITLKDIFNDGRFRTRISREEEQAIIDEIWREVK